MRFLVPSSTTRMKSSLAGRNQKPFMECLKILIAASLFGMALVPVYAQTMPGMTMPSPSAPSPLSVKPSQYQAALQAVAGDRRTGEEMAAIAAINKNNRLIKGHVFLWRDGQAWEDLWDMNGEIRQ